MCGPGIIVERTPAISSPRTARIERIFAHACIARFGWLPAR